MPVSCGCYLLTYTEAIQVPTQGARCRNIRKIPYVQKSFVHKQTQPPVHFPYVRQLGIGHRPQIPSVFHLQQLLLDLQLLSLDLQLFQTLVE